MLYLPALILDTFLGMLEATMNWSDLPMPRCKVGKPTVIILE